MNNSQLFDCFTCIIKEYILLATNTCPDIVADSIDNGCLIRLLSYNSVFVIKNIFSISLSLSVCVCVCDMKKVLSCYITTWI